MRAPSLGRRARICLQVEGSVFPRPRPSRHEDYSCHRDVLGVWPFRQGSLIHSGIEYAGREPLLSPTTNIHRHAQPMAGRKTVPGAEVTPEDTK